MIVGIITGKKLFWNCSMDVITIIKTVFKATFSLVYRDVDNDRQFCVKLVAASTGAVLKFKRRALKGPTDVRAPRL